MVLNVELLALMEAASFFWSRFFNETRKRYSVQQEIAPETQDENLFIQPKIYNIDRRLDPWPPQ